MVDFRPIQSIQRHYRGWRATVCRLSVLHGQSYMSTFRNGGAFFNTTVLSFGLALPLTPAQRAAFKSNEQ